MKARAWIAFALLVTGLILTHPAGGAAPDNSKNSWAAELVQAALKAELEGAPESRRALLDRTLARDPDFVPARWQSGSRDPWTVGKRLKSEALAMIEFEKRLETAREWKDRIETAPLESTDFKKADSREAWFRQLYDYNEKYTPPRFPVYPSGYERLQIRYTMSCFPAGTPIHTMSGPRPIEQVRTGDRIRATRGHPFWINGQGWRMAKQLKVGDRLHGLNGALVIDRIAEAPATEAYNLVVSDFGMYFVGDNRVLVHDNMPLAETTGLVPGLGAQQQTPAAPDAQAAAR